MSIDNASYKDWNVSYNNVEKERPQTLADLIKSRLIESSPESKQIGGNHYKTKIQPWDVFLDWEMDPWLCNVIKYVQRHAKKNGIEDLEKAKHYLEFAIENYDKIKAVYYK